MVEQCSHKDVHVLIPRTYAYVTLRGKKHLAEVIKVKDLGVMLSWIIQAGPI